MKYALAFATVLALAACNSGGSSSPPAPVPTPPNISGDYTGTLQDATLGSGPVTGTLAQQGSAAGGTLTFSPASGSVTAAVSMNVGGANAVAGQMVINFANGSTCSYSTTGSYSASTNVLSGTYTATTGCSGDTGTYTLTQQCFDRASRSVLGRRVRGSITHC